MIAAWAMICAATFCLTPPYRVVDGDTFHDGFVQVRLWGVNAPERGEPGWAEAGAALRALVADQPLACEPKGPATYGRMPLDCTLLNGERLSCAMIGEPYVTEWLDFSGGAFKGCEE